MPEYGVLIVCLDHQHSRHVRQLLAAAGAVPEWRRLHAVPSDDIWARDHGPITVYRNDQPVLLGFRFNGWGGKHDCDLDDRSNTRLHALGAFGATPLERVELILEGGGIETDGRGTLLTYGSLHRATMRLPAGVLGENARSVHN